MAQQVTGLATEPNDLSSSPRVCTVAWESPAQHVVLWPPFTLWCTHTPPCTSPLSLSLSLCFSLIHTHTYTFKMFVRDRSLYEKGAVKQARPCNGSKIRHSWADCLLGLLNSGLRKLTSVLLVSVLLVSLKLNVQWIVGRFLEKPITELVQNVNHSLPEIQDRCLQGNCPKQSWLASEHFTFSLVLLKT